MLTLKKCLTPCSIPDLSCGSWHFYFPKPVIWLTFVLLFLPPFLGYLKHWQTCQCGDRDMLWGPIPWKRLRRRPIVPPPSRRPSVAVAQTAQRRLQWWPVHSALSLSLSSAVQQCLAAVVPAALTPLSLPLLLHCFTSFHSLQTTRASMAHNGE